MKYKNIVKGQFLSRPNRFIAKVLIDGKEETVHVKNTGRCRELLTPMAEVFLEKSDNPARKTAYDLIGVKKVRKGKPPLMVNMDSQAPNEAAFEWLPKSGLFSGNAVFRREVTHENSRFDLYIEDGDRKAFMEVKGVTLEDCGIASFPDAPTERGVKHIRELMECVQQGYEAYILFVVQMKEMKYLKPNDTTHRAFGDALRAAASAGVKVLAYDCRIEADSMIIDEPLPVNLKLLQGENI